MEHEFNFPLHIERGDDPSKLIEVCYMKLRVQPNICICGEIFLTKYKKNMSIVVPNKIFLKQRYSLILPLSFVYFAISIVNDNMMSKRLS